MTPKFTVVIPAYNVEKFVAQTLRALAGQTHGGFEVVVVDDGSADGTYEVLCEIAGADPRVRVFRQENSGPLIARRTAMKRARGEYAVFLDADDLLREDALGVIAEAIERTGADIVSFPFSRLPDFSVAEGMQLAPGVYRGESYVKVRECVCRGRFNSLWGKAVRLRRIDMDADYGAYKGLMHGEDLFQLLPIIDRCESLVQIEEPLYYYRDNGTSSTSRFRLCQLDDIIVVNRRLVEYANKWGGACFKLAVVGEVKQYINLLKMSELGTSTPLEKERAFSDIASVMEAEGTFNRIEGSALRRDEKILAVALMRRWRRLAQAVIAGVEAMKRWR